MLAAVTAGSMLYTTEVCQLYSYLECSGHKGG